MQFTRRDTLVMGAGAAIATFMPFRAFADLTEDETDTFADGAVVTDGGVEVTAPEIAENGNTVPISVSAPGAVSILVLASGNPAPRVIEFGFGPRSGSSSAATRCRLAGTQNIIALAKMADGSVMRGTAAVKVTIGGCGG